MRLLKMTRIATTMFVLYSIVFGFVIAVAAQQETSDEVRRALSFKPRQSGVDYDVPSDEQIPNCTIESSLEKFGRKGYVVYDETGRILRQFFDADRNGKIDQWSFFKGGIEVYRDLDTDNDRKTDQYRWMGTAGTRWGLDPDQDGHIDFWKMISAEEVAFEAFESVRTKDVERFRRLLPNFDDLKSLNLGKKMEKAFAARVQTASSKFSSLVDSQKHIDSKSTYIHFGSGRPSLIPKGQQGIQQDIIVYDQASAVFKSADFGSLSLGTIIRVRGAWRMTELPQVVTENTVVSSANLFYPLPEMALANTTDQNAVAQEMIKLFGEFDVIENDLRTVTKPSDIEALENKRAGLLLKLAIAADGQDRQNWIRQMADTITGAFQNDRFDDALNVLASNMTKLKELGMSSEQDYAAWRILNAKYSKRVSNGTTKQRGDASEIYMDDLAEFIDDFAKSSFAAEALMQMALYNEVSDGDGVVKSLKLYRKAAKQFPETTLGKRAAGAVVRLTSQDKKIEFIGKDLKGRTFRLSNKNLRGKIVVIHYWESWCDSCIEGFDELQKLGAKYNSDLVVVAANMDPDSTQLKEFIAKNRSQKFIHLHGPGGFEQSELAIQLGIGSLPMTMLIDQKGNLIESNVPVGDLDREIQRLMRRSGVATGPKKSRRK